MSDTREDESARRQPEPGWEPPPWAGTTARSPWQSSAPAEAWPDPRAADWYGRYGQAGSYPPPWATAGGWSGIEPGSSGAAVVAASAMLILGALILLFSIILVAFGAAGDELLQTAAAEAGIPDGGSAIATIILVVGVVGLVLGVLHMLAAIGVFVHKEWARWLGIALAALGLALGALVVLGSVGDATSDGATWIVLIGWVGGYLAILGGLAAGGEHFRLRARSRY